MWENGVLSYLTGDGELPDNYVIKLSTEYENTLWQIFSVYHIPETSDYIRTDFIDMKQNIENKMDNCPQFLVYDEKNELNVSATLKNIPAHLDKTINFFREVPEWFEAGSDNLDELRETLTAIDNMPEEERKKHSPEEIRKMRYSMERMISCYEALGMPDVAAEYQRQLEEYRSQS
mgnify:CR=1 FL=1